MSEHDPRLRSVYTDEQGKQTRYDDWAETYNRDLVDSFGYVAHLEACARLCRLVPDTATRILDAGCGTGLAGKHLAGLGYTNLHGRDFSAGMLDQATITAAYQTLVEHDFLTPLSEEHAYDAAIAVGLFAFGPLAAEHLVHVARAVTVDRPAVITVNGKAWNELDWPEQLNHFTRTHSDFAIEDVAKIPYLKRQGIDGRLLTLYRKA